MRTYIDGFVDGAVFARNIHVPQSADINNIWVLRIDRNSADLARVLQADVLPRRTAVRGFVDAVTGREVFANVVLATPGINTFRIGGGHGMRADRAHRLRIEYA